MEAKLILIADDGRPGEYKLKLPVIMGRSRQAGLTVLHSSVSRQHCEFTEYEGQLVVNDLGSLNGTFIEETRIAEPTILPDGGLLRVGSVRFQAAYGSADLAPPPVPATSGAKKPAAPGLLPPGAEGADPMLPASEGEAFHSPPETEPLQPVADSGELELMLDEEVGNATPAAAAEDEPLEFLALDEPQAPPPPPKPKAAAKVPPQAPAPAPRRAPTPAPPAAAPTKASTPQKPASSDEQTMSFLPGAPEAPKDEALAEDLDSFFKSLQ